MMKKVIIEIVLDPVQIKCIGETELIRRFLGNLINSYHGFEIIKKSIDARKKSSIVIKYRCAVELDDRIADRLIADGYEEYKELQWQDTPELKRKPCSVIVVGSGPAGLFCALRLTDAGVNVTLLERGKPVKERDTDVLMIKKTGIVNEESNVVFGEGGAGTYSDGKLTTRIHKGQIDYVFHEIVEFGAPGNILYDAKPHIGTDILSGVVSAIRRYLEDKGATVIFKTKVTSLIIGNDGVCGVSTESGKEYLSDAVVLATGHSARDTYEMLNAQGITLEKKGFAAGFRIEHPAEFINRAQYGSFAEALPAADYRLAYNNPESGRGVYSFCMCPGGEVINSSSERDMLCVNGMSLSSRNGEYSNAAIVMSLSKDDFPGDILSGIEFQRTLERNAFKCSEGSSGVPAQKAADFVRSKCSTGLIQSSYMPSIIMTELSSVFPDFMRKELVRGLNRFDRIIPGFIENGLCIGVESRTSSPVRITRSELMESVSMRNLYPVGEGAGYAGGIISSAVDGVKCADMIISRLSF